MVNTVHFSCPRIMMKKIAPLGHKKTRANATISRCFSVQTTCLHAVIRTVSLQLCTAQSRMVAYGLHIVCMGPPYSLYGPPYKNCKILIFRHISLTSIFFVCDFRLHLLFNHGEFRKSKPQVLGSVTSRIKLVESISGINPQKKLDAL